MKRVYVTGGNGFLGSSVVAGLAGASDQVELIVSADIRPPAGDRVIDGVIYEIADVTDAKTVSEQIAEHRIDTVVHLASMMNPGKDVTLEQEYAVDVTGTGNVLAACVAAGVGRIVVSSSGAAYGYHADNPSWLIEEDPVRGNDSFAYSRHKRLVEEMLAEFRETNPELEQVVLRIGTILGETVDNQITDLFKAKRLLKIKGSDSPFVFIWDQDVVAIIEQAVLGDVTGIFNVAGDGRMKIGEIAEAMGKHTIVVPVGALKTGLKVAGRFGLTDHGPEQTDFLQYRPVLDNRQLKETFGYKPQLTTRQAFKAWQEANGL